jgi:hypothetical protein
MLIFEILGGVLEQLGSSPGDLGNIVIMKNVRRLQNLFVMMMKARAG